IEVIGRTSITLLANNIQRNEYRFCHNYNGPGRYFISTEDPNRVGGILNVNFPNSIQIPFSIFTVYTLTNQTFFGCNSSPVLQQEPLDRACVGEIWTHNPGAFDPDGDSLSFQFTVPLVAQGVPVPNYRFPNEIGGIGSLIIDERTGQIQWDAPNQAGEYNLAFLVISYRNGSPLDTMIRDMQILVEDCVNRPPEIDKDVEEICVVAGELIEFDVTATAPLIDTDQRVSLRAAGGPFVTVAPRASFLPTNLTGFEDDPVTRTFRWQTTCDHISSQPYFVVFRAEDNFFADTAGLSTIQTVAITVVAPPPQNIQAEEEPGVVTLRWDLPYLCEATENPEFIGFTVWRREGSNNFVPDTCETGLAGRGYTLLTPDPINEIDGPQYVYFDETVERGRTYCYRLLAEFARRSPVNGLILEEKSSIPSEEICVQLPRDIPLLTKVDVTATDVTNGTIDVCWIRPDAMALDTSVNRGPFRYVLSRAEGLNPAPGSFSQIAEFSVDNFADPIDTCFTDSGLNTLLQSYSYLIEFYVHNEPEPTEGALPASSVFLAAAPTDEANILSWDFNVPWTNASYDIFRRLPGASVFDSLITVAEPSYTDMGLINGEEYCYFIRASGSYGVDNIPSPLINRSQEICSVPFDNVAPCPPVLTVSSVCDRGVDCTQPDNLFNLLSWEAPIDVCGDDDVAGYRIYYAPDSSSAPQQIAEIDGSGILSFEHMPPTGIVGCYFMTAFDLNNNESESSNEVCVTNCPFYELPNAFTPNADTQNDLFRPRGFCFVESVDFQVFNRWGGLVFETNDPALNWDGNDLSGGQLASGTYYYVCRVFERRLDGVVENSEPLRGYIELVRGR
ncbi:MAG: gliding motility-associated C-terminal domain-containing protein, partial [Bacteroidota bacterium]